MQNVFETTLYTFVMVSVSSFRILIHPVEHDELSWISAGRVWVALLVQCQQVILPLCTPEF